MKKKRKEMEEEFGGLAETLYPFLVVCARLQIVCAYSADCLCAFAILNFADVRKPELLLPRRRSGGPCVDSTPRLPSGGLAGSK
jgi:hypothetical protein